MIKKIASTVAFVAMLIALLVGFVYKQEVRDIYFSKTATQQAEASEVGKALNLTDKGQLIYLASQPQIQSSTEFNKSCQGALHSHSIVLGCYTAQRIYVYDVKDERLDGVKEVTAAHELLHAVYERLSSSEKTALGSQLRSVAESISDERLQQTINEYRSSGEEVLTNELHSILGTELAVLPSSLENHYKNYFTDRQKIVSYSKQYEETFESLKEEIADYDLRLEQLRSRKVDLEDSAQSLQSAIEQQRSRLNELQQNNQIEAYNSAVPSYNTRIRTYNSTIAQLKDLIEEYNQIVDKRNELAAAQNDLVQELDSDYETL